MEGGYCNFKFIRPNHMEKALQLNSKLRKCCRSRNILSTDRISELPDDILVIILSHLTMKEAARTSIISHRWKNLWTHTTGSLDFDGSKILWTIKVSLELGILGPETKPELERPGYISRVNRILNSHKGPTIDGFRVHFDLDLSSRSDIDSWINFALRKRARRLELDLERLAGIWDNCYPFPAQALGHPTINCLTYLKLNYVDVTREVLEYFLSNCPVLEVVCVTNSPCLVGAKVFAASPNLKRLEISHCHNVEFLEISAINLTSLTYSGPKARLRFKNAPNLADMSFGGFYCGYIIEKFRRHSIPLSQIEKLKLELTTCMFLRFDRFPELKNLKQLELILAAWDQRSLLCCTSLLKACPMLYRLSLEFDWWEDPEVREVETEKCTLKCLKLVELSGFRGSSTDVELATYLVTNAPSLKKITIDTRDPLFLGTLMEVLEEEKAAAKACAEQLSTKLSPGTQLVIL